MSAELIGKKLGQPLKHPQTGQMLLPAGIELTESHVTKLVQQGFQSQLVAALKPAAAPVRGQEKEVAEPQGVDLAAFEIEIPPLPDLKELLALRVLIVDDAPFMRKMLKGILEPQGYRCFEAGSGREAIIRYQEVKPDVVTMDITMPEMDGLEALKEIRKFDKKARVLMCSAMGQEGFVKDAIASGVRDFILKPFNPERVTTAINKALGK